MCIGLLLTMKMLFRTRSFIKLKQLSLYITNALAHTHYMDNRIRILDSVIPTKNR